MTRTTAVVLAGGASRRMGIDKRSLRLFPTSLTFLHRTLAVGRVVADRVVVIGEPYPEGWGARPLVVPDKWPTEGPLGALVTAFDAFPDDRLLVLASDYPLLQAELAALVLDGLDGRDGSIAVDRGRRHPLVGAYDARRCAGIAATMFGAGERSMAALLARLSIRLVTASADDRPDVHGLSLTNVNTPEEVDVLRARCRSRDLDLA